MKRKLFLVAIVSGAFLFGVCKKKKDNTPTAESLSPVSSWVTRADAASLLERQTSTVSFSPTGNSYPVIEIDTTTTYQTVDGFGFSLTGGSAYLINHMDAASRATLLNNLFGAGADAISVSYLRISIGASDLDASVFSYDDMPTGQTDPTLSQFSLGRDTVDLIPVLKQILAINPAIKILGSPWSAPVWMKDNGSSIGGTLQANYFGVYAQYFVKYIQAMQARGINIDAITIQNEPQYGGNNPSMVLSAQQETDFVKNNLGPSFRTAGINTKIIVWDHNCNNPNYPITILNDPAAKAFIDGSAFHLYEGEIGALSGVHAAHPDKNLYFTEQWTGANGSFDGDLKWHTKNVIIGSMKNWSKVALEWNLASDPTYNPHTPGGCSECKGAITINGSGTLKNVSYYIIGQASKFITPGSIRIGSSEGLTLSSVAFKRPDGKKVLLTLNEGTTAFNFNIKYRGQLAPVVAPAGSVTTFVW